MGGDTSVTVMEKVHQAMSATEAKPGAPKALAAAEVEDDIVLLKNLF